MHRALASLVSSLLVLSACSKEEEPKPEPVKPKVEPVKPPEPPKPDPALVERGAYLAQVMTCAMCHTAMGPQGPDMANAFGGGLEVTEPFGKWRSPNISQDKKTGIGGWTDEQIITAIREGKRPDGTTLYPIMPYLFFNALSNEDAKALVAFLRTLPAVDRTVAGNTDLKLPKPPAPPAKGDEWPAEKRGEYLATLMHCGFCHTPIDEKTFAPDMTKMFAGGFPMPVPPELEPMLGKGMMYSANITSDPATGLGKWTEEQIAQTLTTGKRPDGRPLRSIMGMLSMMVISKMKPEDVKALAGYVKSIPPVKNKVPEGKFTPPAGPPPGAPPH